MKKVYYVKWETQRKCGTLKCDFANSKAEAIGYAYIQINADKINLTSGEFKNCRQVRILSCEMKIEE